MDIEKSRYMLSEIAKLMGASDETIEYFKNFPKDAERSSHWIDNENNDIEGNHKKIMEASRMALKSFEHADMVECDETIINKNMLEAIWSNMSAYSYDIENFFLERFIFLLKKDRELIYKMYFSIEDGNIFLFVKNHIDEDVVCGTVAIDNGKFLPYGAVDKEFLDTLVISHMKEKLPFDRQFIGNRTIMNCLLYIIVTNQLVNQSREIITETSRRIDVQKKSSKSGKKSKAPKKTKLIKYIKVDTEKISKVREEYERQEREKYERHTSQWSRRGHYKRLRNGETKWIKPTMCHAKDNDSEQKTQKLYRLK